MFVFIITFTYAFFHIRISSLEYKKPSKFSYSFKTSPTSPTICWPNYRAVCISMGSVLAVSSLLCSMILAPDESLQLSIQYQQVCLKNFPKIYVLVIPLQFPLHLRLKTIVEMQTVYASMSHCNILAGFIKSAGGSTFTSMCWHLFLVIQCKLSTPYRSVSY